MPRFLIHTRLLPSPSPPPPIFTHLPTPSPDFNSLLKTCSALTHIHQTHAFMVHRALDHHPLLLSRFIDTCSTLGFPDYGYALFADKPQPNNTHLWNTAIRALSLSSSPSSPTEAVLLFNRIRVSGLRPDTYSFPFVLMAVVRLSVFDLGRGVHCQATVSGLGFDVNVATGLVDMYSKLGCVFYARKVFDEIPCRHLPLWNAIVSGYARAGELDNARELFEEMPERNVISWTAVVVGYAQMNRSNEALALFWQMLQNDHVKPNEVTVQAALSACADLSALETGKWIHCYIDKHKLLKTVPLMGALIDMYVKSGNIGMGLALFEEMDDKSVVTWTTMIDGLARHGRGTDALKMFFRMKRAKVKPNEITFIAILSACNYIGLVKIGMGCFNSMGLRHGIRPTVEHYGCIIDLLGRAGFLQRALELVREMPFEANGTIWGSLLASSRIHGNLELARHALQHLVEVEPTKGGNYKVLSDIYDDFGRWNEAWMVRKAMRDHGFTTMPGGSSIEVNSGVHEFITGDISHPQSGRICEVLDLLNCHWEMVDSVQLECGVAA